MSHFTHDRVEFVVCTSAGEFITEPMTPFEFERRVGAPGGRYKVQTGEHAKSIFWFTLLANQVVAYREL